MYVRLNGTKLFYTALGKGRPLIFLHGGLGFDHNYFRPWTDPLAKQFRVVYYDHRGNGRSDGRESLGTVTHETWIDDLDALRKHLGFKKFTLVGHSYGGALGMGYALKYQRHLDGLVIITSYAGWDFWHEAIANGRKLGTPEQVAALRRMEHTHFASDEEFGQVVGTVTPLYFKNVDMKVLERIGATTKVSYQAFNRGFIDCHRGFNLVPRLGEIKTPTLVMAARDDKIIPISQSERIHRGIKGSKMVVFENSRHFPFIEERKKFNATLAEWAAGLK
ncbi:MAG: alpha/beta fold hydrolase [SAR202 cluster bacterium]|nr:alpha/beta fold hydrolase [SAR202 cluster bacterium]